MKNKSENSNKPAGKFFDGVVISDKMNKTLVVLVSRFTKHPKYDKFVRSRKKYKVHNDSDGKVKVGDKVRIRETRPISRDKRFKLVSSE